MWCRLWRSVRVHPRPLAAGSAGPTLRAGDWGLRAAKSAALRPQRLTPALGSLAVGWGEEHGRDEKWVEVEERWQMKLSW